MLIHIMYNICAHIVCMHAYMILVLLQESTVQLIERYPQDFTINAYSYVAWIR